MDMAEAEYIKEKKRKETDQILFLLCTPMVITQKEVANHHRNLFLHSIIIRSTSYQKYS